MATIVTQYHQPYWQQAALGLATNLLGNALQRSQEADNNRKMNAVIQKSMSEANAAAGQYAGQNLLTGQPLPDGYNSDAWAKTMHDSYTPMTQFDLGTDAATGRLSTPRIPTQMEYLSALLGNLDTQRFGGLNTKSAYEAFAPVIAAGEKTREQQLAEQQRAMQQQFANSLSLMETPEDLSRAVMTYIASGFAPKDAINAMEKLSEHLNPHYQAGSINAGGTIYPYAQDPSTGAFNFMTDRDGVLTGIPVSNTPYQDDTVALKWADMYNSNEQDALERANKLQIAGMNGTKYETITKGAKTYLIRTGPNDPEGTVVQTFDHVPTQKEIAEIANYNSQIETRQSRGAQPDFFTKADYNSITSELGKLSTQRLKATADLSKAQEELNGILAIPGAEKSDIAKTTRAQIEGLRQQINDLDVKGQALEAQRQQLKTANTTPPKDAMFGTPLPVSGDISSNDIASTPPAGGNLLSPDNPVPAAIPQTGVSNDDIRPTALSPDVPYSDPLLSADTPAQSASTNVAPMSGKRTVNRQPLTQTTKEQPPQTPKAANEDEGGITINFSDFYSNRDLAVSIQQLNELSKQLQLSDDISAKEAIGRLMEQGYTVLPRSLEGNEDFKFEELPRYQQTITPPPEMIYDPNKHVKINPELIFNDEKLKALMMKYNAPAGDILRVLNNLGYKYRR